MKKTMAFIDDEPDFQTYILDFFNEIEQVFAHGFFKKPFKLIWLYLRARNLIAQKVYYEKSKAAAER